jgi:hypothetical protein
VQEDKKPNPKEKGSKLDIDEAERQRRSKLAKELHKKGVFGGKQRGAGRPKKDRAQEHVAEAVRDEAENIVKALKAALNSGQPSTRLKAALAMLDIEQREHEFVMRQEQRAYDNLSREALLELIAQRIAQLNKAGVNFDMEGTATEVITKELNA